MADSGVPSSAQTSQADPEPALSLWVHDVIEEGLYNQGVFSLDARAVRARNRRLQDMARRLWNIWVSLCTTAGFPIPALPSQSGVKNLADRLVGSYDPDLVAKMVLALARSWTAGLHDQIAEADNHPHKPIRNWPAPDLIQLVSLSESRRPRVMELLQAAAEGKAIVKQARLMTPAEREHADTLRGETTVPPEEMIGPAEGVEVKKIKKSRLN